MLNADAAVRAAQPVPCPADLTGDRLVNGSDLGILLASWGTNQNDINGDGFVDGSDLGMLLSAWGACP
jgi:hypothetical protein